MALFIEVIKVYYENMKIAKHGIVQPKADTQNLVALLPVFTAPKPIIFCLGFFIGKFVVFAFIASFTAIQILDCIIVMVDKDWNFYQPSIVPTLLTQSKTVVVPWIIPCWQQVLIRHLVRFLSL